MVRRLFAFPVVAMGVLVQGCGGSNQKNDADITLSARPSSSSDVNGPIATPTGSADNGFPDRWPEARLPQDRACAPGDAPTLDDKTLAELGVRQAKACVLQAPARLAYLYMFDSYAAADKARQSIVAKSEEQDTPFYPKATVTGRYLLVVGFPSHKPPSDEMIRAQTDVLSAFAGEE